MAQRGEVDGHDLRSYEIGQVVEALAVREVRIARTLADGLVGSNHPAVSGGDAPLGSGDRDSTGALSGIGILWVPLTYLPQPPVYIAWDGVLIGAAVWALSRASLPLAAVVAPFLLWSAVIGSVEALNADSGQTGRLPSYGRRRLHRQTLAISGRQGLRR